MSIDFQTPGYEHFQLSTQVLIAEALNRGIHVEILDPEAQFIRLSKGKKVEFVQEATKTSLDSYVVSLILGNKWVTKQILIEKGIKVPRGFLFTQEAEARMAYAQFSSGHWVVKPKTTNFGIGITILPESASQNHFEAAVRMAFHEDTTIVIEEFIDGPETRFLVIDNKVVAVMHRVPANVVGDGTHTIQQLVEIINSDPRRGKGHRTPLEKIQLGQVELNELKQQGLAVESIPVKNRQIFLRKNSNISTGGNSFDLTDDVDKRYKKLAIEATRAVGARICGVDMIIGPKDYGVIELNFNPVLFCHDFPYEGKNRHTGRAVLDALGF